MEHPQQIEIAQESLVPVLRIDDDSPQLINFMLPLGIAEDLASAYPTMFALMSPRPGIQRRALELRDEYPLCHFPVLPTTPMGWTFQRPVRTLNDLTCEAVEVVGERLGEVLRFWEVNGPVMRSITGTTHTPYQWRKGRPFASKQDVFKMMNSLRGDSQFIV